MDTHRNKILKPGTNANVRKSGSKSPKRNSKGDGIAKKFPSMIRKKKSKEGTSETAEAAKKLKELTAANEKVPYFL